MNKLIPVIAGVAGLFLGAKMGIEVGKSHKERMAIEPLVGAVPSDKKDEAVRAAEHVAAVTGDSMEDVEVKMAAEFKDRTVYVVDSDFKIFACSVAPNGSMEVSGQIPYWV